jgi:hypothetical protein
MRTLTIGVFSVCGGIFLSQGAVRNSWRMITFGLVLLSLAFGIILVRRRDNRRYKS